MSKKMIIANWKMYRSYTDSIAWSKEHKQELVDLAKKVQLVICPELTPLATMATIFDQTPIALGAQNCDYILEGAHTGEVAASSLAQLGCTFCIVGHWERYHLFNETLEHVIQKINLLLAHTLQPIVCVNDQNFNEQLKALAALKIPSLIIAYEPVNAIGTGTIPDLEQLNTTLLSIRQAFTIPQVTLLYGGSVNPATIDKLAQLTVLDGYLIGSLRSKQRVVGFLFL